MRIKPFQKFCNFLPFRLIFWIGNVSILSSNDEISGENLIELLYEFVTGTRPDQKIINIKVL